MRPLTNDLRRSWRGLGHLQERGIRRRGQCWRQHRGGANRRSIAGAQHQTLALLLARNRRRGHQPQNLSRARGEAGRARRHGARPSPPHQRGHVASRRRSITNCLDRTRAFDPCRDHSTRHVLVKGGRTRLQSDPHRRHRRPTMLGVTLERAHDDVVEMLGAARVAQRRSRYSAGRDPVHRHLLIGTDEQAFGSE